MGRNGIALNVRLTELSMKWASPFTEQYELNITLKNINNNLKNLILHVLGVKKISTYLLTNTWT